MDYIETKREHTDFLLTKWKSDLVAPVSV